MKCLSLVFVLLWGGCGDGASGADAAMADTASTDRRTVDAPGVDVPNPLTDPTLGPPAGNPEGSCSIPEEAGLADSSSPDQVVGDGSAASCTGDAFIAAVALGGVITFDCGPDPVTITVDRPAKIFNDTGPEIVIDGGGLVTLSGGGSSRILYMNTCDEAQNWTTAMCQNQDHPRLTVQNLTFIDADSRNENRVRRRRGYLGTRRPLSGAELSVLQQHLCRRGSRRGRCCDSGV